MADNLQDLLDLLNEAGVIDWLGQLDVAKVARTFTHRLGTCLALELPVDGAEKGVVEATVAWLCLVLFHRLGVENVCHTHVFDLLRGHQTKLNLLDRLERRARVRKRKVRHLESILLLICGRDAQFLSDQLRRQAGRDSAVRSNAAGVGRGSADVGTKFRPAASAESLFRDGRSRQRLSTDGL